MKKWYKMWKKSGPSEGLDEGYVYTEESFLEEEMENFANNMGGGFSSRYSYGYEEIKYPPIEWIKKHIKHTKQYIETLENELLELEEIVEDYAVDEAFNS